MNSVLSGNKTKIKKYTKNAYYYYIMLIRVLMYIHYHIIQSYRIQMRLREINFTAN